MLNNVYLNDTVDASSSNPPIQAVFSFFRLIVRKVKSDPHLWSRSIYGIIGQFFAPPNEIAQFWSSLQPFPQGRDRRGNRFCGVRHSLACETSHERSHPKHVFPQMAQCLWALSSQQVVRRLHGFPPHFLFLFRKKHTAKYSIRSKFSQQISFDTSHLNVATKYQV